MVVHTQLDSHFLRTNWFFDPKTLIFGSRNGVLQQEVAMFTADGCRKQHPFFAPSLAYIVIIETTFREDASRSVEVTGRRETAIPVEVGPARGQPEQPRRAGE